MKTFAIVENETVVNIAVADSALDLTWILLSDESASIGDKYVDGKFVKEEKEPVPVEPDTVLLKKITITSIQDAIKNNSTFTHITCYKKTKITVNGAVDVPDQTFSLSLINLTTAELELFAVEVIDGEFSASLYFEKSGQYAFNNEQANRDLLEPVFTVEPIKIEVLNQPV